MTASDLSRQVTVVIVTYNSAHVIGQCLKAIDPALPIILIDNGSADGTCEIARQARPDSRIVVNPVNVGFGCAVNQGFNLAETAYGLLLAPDAVLSADAPAALLDAACAYPEAAVLAPICHGAAGVPELSVMGPGERRHRPLDQIPAGDFCTWFVTGAVLLCRLDAWMRIGGFDSGIFLYNEDAELSLRMGRAGCPMVIVAAAAATHLGGKGVAPTRRHRWLKDWHMTWSHLYVEGKHGDPILARREARALLVRHGLKTLFYCLVPRPARARGNFAKAHAAWWFLKGRPARRP